MNDRNYFYAGEATWTGIVQVRAMSGEAAEEVAEKYLAYLYIQNDDKVEPNIGSGDIENKISVDAKTYTDDEWDEGWEVRCSVIMYFSGTVEAADEKDALQKIKASYDTEVNYDSIDSSSYAKNIRKRVIKRNTTEETTIELDELKLDEEEDQ